VLKNVIDHEDKLRVDDRVHRSIIDEILGTQAGRYADYGEDSAPIE